jgi:AraC-like DNA-binding protein
LFTVNAPSLKVATSPQQNLFGLDVPLGRPFLVNHRGQPRPFNSDIHLLEPNRGMDLEVGSDLRILAVKLDRERVEEFALKLNGSRKAFELGNEIVISHPDAAHAGLVQSIAVLWSELQRKDEFRPSAINIAESVDRVPASFCLAAQTDEWTVGRSDERSTPVPIAMAEDYLRARLDKPVSRADLAAASGLPIRTLSRGFANRRGMGPMGFWRRLRIEAAYRDLLGAAPEATSVTEVAHRYGFDHLGKFAVEYKRAFHESPSETLRH